MGKITLIGLGPGAPDLLTRRADAAIERASVVYVTRATRNIAAAIAGRAVIVAIDELAPAAETEPEARRKVAERVLSLGQRPEGVTFGAPGDPLIDDPVCREIVEQAKAVGLTAEIINGLSWLDSAAQALGVDRSAIGLQIIGAAELAAPLVPETTPDAASPSASPFLGVYRLIDPTRPVLVQEVTPPVVPDLRRALAEIYSEDYPISMVPVDRGPTPAPLVTSVRELARPGTVIGRNALYLAPVAPLSDVAAFDTLRYIVARLRAPGGCPWDREQTFQSIKKHLLEETYEAVAALDEDDYGRFAEELGDVLLQVVMYAQFGREAGRFTLEDVLRMVNEKLIRRHPHVFGNVQVGSSAEVLRNWEQIKRTEKGGKETSTFSGIPPTAPALMRAESVQSRATRHGWVPPAATPDCGGIADPYLTPARRLDAIGEILFDLVAVARRYQIDPEEALRRATNRFIASQTGA